MKIAILGFDVEGRASYDYFAPQGHEITICDQNPEVQVPEGVEAVLGENYLDNLDRFDLLVRTAGLSPHKILDKNPGVADKITTHLNEFMKVCPTRNVIGVTGTKGKGTTSTLITKMLEESSLDVRLAGNIGLPPLTLLNEINKGSWVVLELSSFQLIDLKYSPHIAVCLMVVPEHLDWHTSIEEYYQAKSQLFAHQTSDDIAIYYAKSPTSKEIVSYGGGQIIPYFAPPGAMVENETVVINGQRICDLSEVQLLGAHNLQNVCAAVTTAWQVTRDVSAIRSVLTSFTGLPHRLEFVRELNGVQYYDDSFSTNPDTAIAALEAFTQPEILILGGFNKRNPFDQLAKVISERPNIKKVITIGETAEEISLMLQTNGYTNIVEGESTMQGIVRQAHELAEPGDVVLLSPASSSFDMFKNYKDRAEQFVTAVQALA